jgi:hypothetical protein
VRVLLLAFVACSTPSAHKPFSDDLDLPKDTTVSADEPTEPVDHPPPTVDRVRGPIKGKIAPEKSTYVAGEPIFVVFDLANTGKEALEFDVGGDFGPAMFPQRYTWVVRDAQDKVLCDLGRDHLAPQGGGGYRVKLGANRTFHETHVGTPVCPALLVPGTYKLTISRVLSQPMNTCDDIALPDLTKLGPGAKDPYGKRDNACMIALSSLPAISSDSTIEITPWDAKALRQKLAIVATEHPTETSRQGATAAYALWYCEHVRCGCPAGIRDESVDDWVQQALSVVPDSPPACP